MPTAYRRLISESLAEVFDPVDLHSLGLHQRGLLDEPRYSALGLV